MTLIVNCHQQVIMTEISPGSDEIWILSRPSECSDRGESGRFFEEEVNVDLEKGGGFKVPVNVSEVGLCSYRPRPSSQKVCFFL